MTTNGLLGESGLCALAAGLIGGTLLSAQAGMAIFKVIPDAQAFSPWVRFAVLVVYATTSLAIGGVVLLRRDA